MEKDMAILMADLSGYTAMTDVHGGISAARLVSRYVEMVNSSLSGNARFVQRTGDQVVLLAEQSTDLVSTIVKLQECIFTENHFLSIHAGLHFGPIHEEQGNLYGSTINIASRIMNLAKAGEILCSSAFVNSVDRTVFSFLPAGKFKFKNVFSEIEVFSLMNRSISTVPIDPVCQMRITKTTGFSHELSGKTFHFCSEHCMNMFLSDIEEFVRH
jgi:adenylate cyclase